MPKCLLYEQDVPRLGLDPPGKSMTKRMTRNLARDAGSLRPLSEAAVDVELRDSLSIGHEGWTGGRGSNELAEVFAVGHAEIHDVRLLTIRNPNPNFRLVQEKVIDVEGHGGVNPDSGGEHWVEDCVVPMGFRTFRPLQRLEKPPLVFLADCPRWWRQQRVRLTSLPESTAVMPDWWQ